MEEANEFWLDQHTNSDSCGMNVALAGGQQPKLEDFSKGVKLGKGMFGEVFRVHHIATGFVCAMKVLSKEFIRKQKV